MTLRTPQLFPLLFWLGFSLGTSLAYAQDMPSPDDLKLINNTIAQIQKKIQQADSERSGVQKKLIETEKSLTRTNQEVRSLNQQISHEQSELKQLQERQITLNNSKSEQQALIGQYMRNAYRSGKDEYLKLLLNQQSIDQSMRTLRYYQYFNEARAGKINSFNSTLVELSSLQSEIKISSDKLESKRQQLGQQQLALKSSQNERQALLDNLDITLSQSGAELAKLEQERAEMELLIEELSRAIRNLALKNQGQSFAELKGQLPWPVDGPLLNSYGQSYELGDLDWQGVVIAGNEGEPVQAIHQGRVIFSEWFANSGLLLIIDHGDGYMSLYAHNQLLYKTVGDWVNSGEVIAAVGNTGGRKESGVYFEIRHNADSVDPISWCLTRN